MAPCSTDIRDTPATLRKTQHRNAIRIDERRAHQKIQGVVGVHDQIERSAVAAVLEAARTEAVHGERHIAPGRDPFPPAFVEPAPISVAAMQQYDGGRGARTIGLPQITLERMGTGQRALDFDDGRGRFSRKARSRISGQECGDEGCAFGEVRHGPPSRSTIRRERDGRRRHLAYIPNIRRALAFNTLGLISSRISSLAKSASQRSGVITGQSEPNSILSCRIELM